jgi:5-methylcytosine-specific restriction enzyme A
LKKRFTGHTKVGRGHIPKAVRKEIFQRDNYACFFCKKKLDGPELTIDHLVPLAEGGLNEPINFVTACIACNQAKADKPLSEFLQQMGLAEIDLPVHLDSVLDNDRIPDSVKQVRRSVHSSIRSGKLKARGKSASRKIEKTYRRRFWETGEGKNLERQFPKLPGHVRIMIPEIKAITYSHREFNLVLELAKSASTRDLISGRLQKLENLEDSIRSLAISERDEKLRKRIAQAVARFDKKIR